ncbi:MFS transporter, partial [Paenibacillus timonensis]|uniref:MFS transporter n=1 Tax=Paenibacillus timonensis TaxID=225915 RepID=UPI003F9DD124
MESRFGGLTARRFHWLFAGLLLSILLTQLDQTIVSTALPTIATQLEGFTQMSWVFTIYMLTSTAMTPIAGKLSDLYGRKVFLVLGLAIFVIGSVLCGSAQSMLQLIIFRGIKGIGAGLLMPITFTVVFSLMPRNGNSVYQTLYMSVFALSSVIGPTVGALITSLLNWRYIFYINLPLGLVIFAIILKLLPRNAVTPKPDASIGYVGPGLLVLGTLSLLLALKMGGVQYAWGSLPILGLLIVG